MNKNIIVCNECKNEFFLNDVNVQESKVCVGKYKTINLVYFTCPCCNKVYPISIQDGKYFDLLSDLNSVKYKIKKNNGTMDLRKANTLNAMVFKKLNRLKKHEEKLKKKFGDGFVVRYEGDDYKTRVIKYIPK